MENLPYIAPLDLCIGECFKMELHEWIDEILPTNLIRTARETFFNVLYTAKNMQWLDGHAVQVPHAKEKPTQLTKAASSRLSSQAKPLLPKAISLIPGRTFAPIGEHYYYSEAISLPKAPKIPPRILYVIPAPFRISPLRVLASITYQRRN